MIMPTDTQQATKELAERYITALGVVSPSYPTKSDELSHRHLLWMCNEVLINYDEWPDHKSNRWLGYVQGVLTALKVMGVDEHRDITRCVVEKFDI